MELFERHQETRFLGREFLTWLWFRSETDPSFPVEGLGTLQVTLGDRIELSAPPDAPLDVVSVRGETTELREARLALRDGKLVSLAKWRFNLDGDEWDLLLDELWLAPRGLKLPKIVLPDDESEPEAILLERIYLIERSVETLDALTKTFIESRISTDWEAGILPALREWSGVHSAP